VISRLAGENLKKAPRWLFHLKIKVSLFIVYIYIYYIKKVVALFRGENRVIGRYNEKNNRGLTQEIPPNGSSPCIQSNPMLVSSNIQALSFGLTLIRNTTLNKLNK